MQKLINLLFSRQRKNKSRNGSLLADCQPATKLFRKSNSGEHEKPPNLFTLPFPAGKSYKEVCSLVIEKCRFVLNEIRPYHASKGGLKSVNILRKEPGFKKSVKDFIKSRKESNHGAGAGGLILRPEDLLNVSIQSQDALIEAAAAERKQEEEQQQQHQQALSSQQQEQAGATAEAAVPSEAYRESETAKGKKMVLSPVDERSCCSQSQVCSINLVSW